MTRSPTAEADRLISEAAAVPLTGWDFSLLAGRVVSDPMPWDYVTLAGATTSRAERVLDIDTGEGEVEHLTGTEFYTELLGALTERGLLMVNVGDDTGHRYYARQAAALGVLSREVVDRDG